jgi:hypothetical protein
MTDSAAVTTRPTQAEAWKKYAVTAVSPENILNGFRSVEQTHPLGYCCWNDHRYEHNSKS